MARQRKNSAADNKTSCGICGGKGHVYRAYLEPGVAHQFARELRPCPKCNVKINKQSRHYIFRNDK